MILTYGNCTLLQGKSWYVLELRSEHTAENVCRRIGRAMPIIFKDGGACEVFVPIATRDINGIMLKTNAYIFVRSTVDRVMGKFKGVTGCLGLLCEGEQQRIDRAIKVEDDYVQQLIQEAELSHRANSANIQVGTFVRLIDGLDKGFCGHVARIDRDYALVKIDLKTRQVFIDTPLANLENLSHVPVDRQVFYYCELVEDYCQEHGESAQEKLAGDLSYQTIPPDMSKVEMVDERKIKYGRHRTVTAFVKGLIYAGQTSVPEILKETLRAVSKEKIRPPKSPLILYATLKQVLMEVLYKGNPEIVNFRDAPRVLGDDARLSVKMITTLDHRYYHIWSKKQ